MAMHSRLWVIAVGAVVAGCEGPAGQDGTPGFNSLVAVTDEAPGLNCAYGGQQIQSGLDNGDNGGVARDGVLQAGEVDSTDYACAGPCQTVSIPAVQSISISYLSGSGYNDDNVRAYSNPSGTCLEGAPPCDVRGWMGFDLSTLPTDVVVISAWLEVWASTVVSTPTIVVQRSAANDWTRAAPGTFLMTDPIVSTPRTLTSAVVGTRVPFVLAIPPPDWAADLADGWATFGVDNTETTYTFAYFSGSASADRPTLELVICPL